MSPFPFRSARAASALAQFLNTRAGDSAHYVVSDGRNSAPCYRYHVARGVGDARALLSACDVQDARDAGFEFPPFEESTHAA